LWREYFISRFSPREARAETTVPNLIHRYPSPQLPPNMSGQFSKARTKAKSHPAAGDKVTLADFKVGVDNVIFSVDTEQNRLLVLLVMRDEDPFLGQWCLPGTLVRQGESLEKGAYRVLSEKIRVENLYLEQLYSFGGPNRDPREAETSFGVRYLSVSYFALVRFVEAELIADGVSGIAWYPYYQVPQLAFDHNEILAYGYRRLKNKLEYSPIAFDVLPELFTLADLYQLYTIILGENFADYSNFRAKLLKLKFLEDTGVKVTRGAGRPASLYRFDAAAFAPLKDKPLVFI
jgi:8-oxo-dGTP diphosphatase